MILNNLVLFKIISLYDIFMLNYKITLKNESKSNIKIF